MSRSRRTVMDQRSKRSSARRIESHAGDNRNCGCVGGGFSPSIELWSQADNWQVEVQVDCLSKAEAQSQQYAADQG